MKREFSEDSPYGLFGLQVYSQLPLPDLPPANLQHARADVLFGAVAAGRDPVWVEDGALCFAIPNVARFSVICGRRIIIDPAPGVEDRELRVCLLGSAFGALLHQRGLLALHANCIEIGDKVVAFLGSSGSGKSTLAYWFQRRGYRVFADDVTAIALDGRPCVLPGLPRLRLWKDALEAAGERCGDFPRSFSGQDKFDVPAAGASLRRAKLLAACYLLTKPENEADRGVSQLKGISAYEALIANTYRGSFVPMLRVSRQHSDACIALAHNVRIFRANRRWGIDHFDEEASTLENHASDLIGIDRCL